MSNPDTEAWLDAAAAAFADALTRKITELEAAGVDWQRVLGSPQQLAVRCATFALADKPKP